MSLLAEVLFQLCNVYVCFYRNHSEFLFRFYYFPLSFSFTVITCARQCYCLLITTIPSTTQHFCPLLYQSPIFLLVPLSIVSLCSSSFWWLAWSVKIFLWRTHDFSGQMTNTYVENDRKSHSWMCHIEFHVCYLFTITVRGHAI